ncbi:uncharacterized protein LOC105690149 [Athalia rosae]|uniref:uncharacterized protein LOC105690149 n=1 Tax=Athalia rosae TaxID=37344 RepID=UPI00203422BD|nr:uncharacterized protein LOC105690149 [Athalia rosae]
MCVMRDTYLKFEPSIVNLGLPGQDLSLLDQIIRKGMKEGMTIVALRRNDERVVGAAINTGSCPWDPRNLVCLADRCQCESIQNLLKFYAHVTASPDLWKEYCVPKIFECTYLSVSNECQGQGLAKRLVRDSWLLARDCGYRLFRIDCTSRYTAKIAKSFGWRCVWSIPYQKYMADGKQVFRHIRAPHTIVEVYVDQIRFRKDYCRPYPVCRKRKKKITTPEIRSADR